tara:strand:- start:25 stop:144 length:120 start_codon:yes stop_codon:yes gene_type:complete
MAHAATEVSGQLAAESTLEKGLLSSVKPVQMREKMELLE